MLLFKSQKNIHKKWFRLTSAMQFNAIQDFLNDLVTILVHYQPSYNTSHTPSDPLLLADIALCWGMYPVGKDDISQHLATPN